MLKGLTVLVVEDEPLVGDMIEDMLVELGTHAVVHARDNASALAAVNDRKPDVVVLDINLSGVQSYPVAAKLAADNVPFIFSTALEKSALAPPWNTRTALQKPFTEQQLQAALVKQWTPYFFKLKSPASLLGYPFGQGGDETLPERVSIGGAGLRLLRPQSRQHQCEFRLAARP